MPRTIIRPKRRLATRLAIILALLLVFLRPYGAESDDTYLFRVQTGKPYVYVILDTSSSMNLSNSLKGAKQDPPIWLPLGAEDPLSTFWEVKSALAEVFDKAFRENGDFIHFGFMRYSQDELRLRGKHWMYAAAAATGQVTIGGLPYPLAGEDLTFGAHLPTSASPGSSLPIPAVGQLGSCQSPVAFSTNRAAVNRFPKLHPIDTNSPLDGRLNDMLGTTIWLQEKGVKYELEVTRHSASPSNFLLNSNPLFVDLTLNTWNSDCSEVTATETVKATFESPRQFFLHDLVDNVDFGIKQNLDEFDGGIWQYHDAEGVAQCGHDPNPHTGEGWEGNYDGGVGYEPGIPVLDPYCNPSNLGQCYSVQHPTVLSPSTLDPTAPIEWRTVDEGDELPYHWENTHRAQFMRRLAPNWSPGKTFADLDFRTAPYFNDTPNEYGVIELRTPGLLPMIPYGGSALAEALTDWRCFYLGTDEGGVKCKQQDQPFGKGFDWLAPQYDLEWGCRRPRILVITDGENNCKANDPSAGSANLKKNGIEAWVINVGPPDNKLQVLANNTGGIYVEAADRDELLAALEKFVGEILEETKAFASAVVPTVQAEEADKVFVSNFKPLNNASVWPGDVQGFLKPVPLDVEGKPNTGLACGAGPGSDPESECFMWSSGAQMLGQVSPNINTQFGLGADQRRLYYSRLSASGDWPNTRRYLSPTANTIPNATAVRYDLWRGFEPALTTAPGLDWSTVTDGSLTAAQEAEAESLVNTAITNMMALKTDDNETPADPSDDLDYILGDIFHSDPLIIGSPSNTKYFALDLQDDGTECDDGNPGYRCFFRKHEKRRKVIMVGANDGQVHAIDAGIFRTSGTFADLFDRGSGKEIFAFSPRNVMPSLRDMYGEGLSRLWTADGSLSAIDAFIDPVDEGSGFPLADEREWRTVVVGGLREGGDTYFALDVTQPDLYDGNGAPSGVGDYVPSCADGGVGCGPVPYPAPLWEFSDSLLVSDPPRELPFDRNGDGFEDMVGTWSIPNLGLMRVCAGANCDPADDDNNIEDRTVAIFGGGLADKSNTLGGNWLYIVDVETGQSIYKRELVDTDGSHGGEVPSEVSAVDTDNDGYLDRIYTPTLKGYVYRTDLYGPNGEIPQLETDFDLADDNGNLVMVEIQRIIADPYRPHLIFKAQPNPATPGPESRAIYYRPSVIFSATLGQHVLALGTGDRENLWTNDGERGVFYVFRDDIPIDDFTTFYTEADLVLIDSEVDGDTTQDLLTDLTLDTKGWFLLLREQERLITNPFGVSGVVVFTVFDPDVEIDLDTLTCARTGKSRIFAVTATSANGLLFEEGDRVRAFTIADFVTEPYVEPSATKNPENEEGGSTADDLTADHIAIMNELKKLFPSNCKFANYRLDIKTLSSDTGIHLIAPVPICIVEKNWKEF